ncbi:MAG: two-component system response regulator [Spirochaetes bacterium GWF1_51_8]|nr:MAG: two-component system response regulator [Spirochaetes bacterium GWF1_51_8]
MSDKPVVILDDESDITDLCMVHLKKSGYRVESYNRIQDFEAGIKKADPLLIILDLMLPGGDGFEILKQLKKEPRYENVPVIMLTARGDEIDKVLGLELGADDYITKPFSPKEFVARIKAVLRRGERKSDVKVISLDRIRIDLQKYDVTVDGKRIDLTTTEFKILALLCEKRGWVYSREQLLNHLWGTEKLVIDRTIDVHIRHLREKMGEAGEMIKNIRGVGYKLE